jgi:serine/threonine-protein kinase
MNLEPGATLLHYRLTQKLGEGGMGVVWRAVDTTLGRDVAVKVLPPHFAADAERLARFDREARVLASLNHPHIAGIYGIHQANGVSFLAMELVDGEDLAARLSRGPLAVDEALRVARDVAAGLEAAHDGGVIHRDLKPANVKVTADGRAKVLDFGLAKAAGAADAVSGGDTSRSPTMTSAGTLAGVILGTASYMSPEQAAGRPTDRRCDVWSFGVMLHELLTGKRMFEGETVSHTLADVLRAPIEMSSLPAEVPRSVRRLLERCLDRNPRQRLRDIGEARIVLERAIEHPEPAEPSAPATTSRAASRLPWLVAGIGFAIGVGSLAWVGLRPEAQPQPTQRFMIAMPNSGNVQQGDGSLIAISPDGTVIVTRGGTGTEDILYLRSLDSFEVTPIAGTLGAGAPEFSPDGRWISFFNNRTVGGLSKIRTIGGTAVPLVPRGISAGVLGYHWASDGYVYYPLEGDIWRVSEDGGEGERLTTADSSRQQGFQEPFAVPEAGVVIFSTTGGPQNEPQLMALDLKTREVSDLGRPGSDPRYVPTGYLVYHQAGKVLAARFDIDAREFRGTSISVLDHAVIDGSHMQVAISANGTVAYLPYVAGQTPAVVYVDHEGRTEPVAPSGLPFSSVNDPRISPDGTRLIVSLGIQAIWVIDVRTQTSTLLTENGFYPIWGPDGKEILYTSNRGKNYDIYRVPVDLSRPEERLLDLPNSMRTMDWTKQGLVVLREEIPGKGMDLETWTDLADPSALKPLLEGADDELAAVVSPDGRWLAYVSNYSGADEVYVTSFPTAGARVKISNAGGHSPAWAPDGKTLYYVQGMKMTAAALETDAAIRVTERKVLFDDEYVQYRWSRQYDITPDGKRFIMIKNPPPGNVEVITNWFAELEKLDD